MLLALAFPAHAAPLFDVERGLYDEPFTLTLTAGDGGTLVYSVDGSAPALPYTSPLSITTTTIVRAAELASDGTSSDVVTSTYVFVDDVLASAVMDTNIVNDPTYGPIVADTLRALPTISLVAPAGIAMTEGPVSFEWIDPEGETKQVNAGAYVSGGTSWQYAKTSFRLVFRSEYGPGRLHLDVYGEDETGVDPVDDHDALSLRSGNHDTVFYLGTRGQHLRNYWMDETQLEMGHVAPHGRFAHVYLNGVYHGMYHVRERFNAAFMAEYLGGGEDDYEAITAGTAFDGSGAAWAATVASANDFETARDWLDVENFLDYMVLNYYAGNAWDWYYYHNWAAAGPTERGAGGFRFHSSDSDICLYYGWDVNILSLGGPSNVFAGLLAEGHPDFRVALEDAIYRNLYGPLSAENTAARYARLAEEAEDAVVAESARWGYSWWDRDGDWAVERDWLLYQWFPYRTDELLRQVRAAGWYPLDAPVLDTAPGLVAAGTTIVVSAPDTSTAELWVALDGTDPRLPGGSTSPSALGPDGARALPVDLSTIVKARLKDGETWGPLVEAFYEVDAAPSLVLNEWNAVDDDDWLGGDDSDATDTSLGRLQGNGGDWIELLVTEDLDLRGWSLRMEDRNGDAGTLVFTDDPVLSEVRAGTILTVAEDLPEDASYAPDRGDWRFHLRAGEDGSGRYISDTSFDVSSRDWRLTIVDADGYVRFGPAGESVSPRAGISGHEVGLLGATPDRDTRRDASAYGGGTTSTFGAPNRWDDGEQDLDALRGIHGGVGDVGEDTASVDSASVDSADGGEAPATPREDAAGGCGCGTTSPAGTLPLLLGLAAVARRRTARAVLAVTTFGACSSPAPAPGDGGEDDTAADAPGDTSSDTSPVCHPDADHDGYGASGTTTPCRGAAVVDGTDCDDASFATNPGAPEVCNTLDDDCDGAVDDADSDLADGLPFWADTDGDGWGDDTTTVTACAAGDGAIVRGGDCDDTDPAVNPDATESCTDEDLNCDGVSGNVPGGAPGCPAESCAEVLATLGTAEDGARWLALPSGTVTEVWCDMTTDGGGWTLGFSRNTASTGSQGDFGSGETGVEGLASSPAAASASSTPVMAWLDLESHDWDELRLAAYASGAESYSSRTIPRTELRIPFGSDGYYLYGGASGYWWCGGNASYTDAGVGATDNPAGAPPDCKGHGSLGSGWDFSESPNVNAGLTLCGGDGSYFLAATFGGTWTYYGTVGGAQAIWVR